MTKRINGTYIPVEQRMAGVEEKLDECIRFNTVQAGINLKHAERAKRYARELELLFLGAYAPTRKERRDARETLALLRSELDAPPSEMAVMADEDRRGVEFSAFVVLAAVAGGIVIVAGLFAWWLCS